MIFEAQSKKAQKGRAPKASSNPKVMGGSSMTEKIGAQSVFRRFFSLNPAETLERTPDPLSSGHEKTDDEGATSPSLFLVVWHRFELGVPQNGLKRR